MKMRYAPRPCLVILFVLLNAVTHVLAGDEKVELKRVSIDGISVFYMDSGPKDAPTLLFIHGWGCNASFWQRQIDAFSDRYRCIALDMPGFGRSDKRQDIDYTLDLFAKAVKAVADDAGATGVVLIGHSMGFAVVRQFLIDYPNEVDAVVNVDGAVMFLPDDPAALAAITEATEQFAQTFAGPGREAALDEFVEGIFYDKTPKNIREIVRKTMTAMDPYVCTSSMKEFVKLEGWKQHSFALPCLALYAENPQEDPNIEKNLRREFSDMTFVLWNDTGHFLMMEKPERFNSALRDFLDALFVDREQQTPANDDGAIYPVTVTVTEQGNRTLVAMVRGHKITIDQPKEFGADDKGPTPPEFLAISFGSCIAATLQLIAAQSNLDIRDISVVVEGTIDFSKALGISGENYNGPGI